MVNKLVFPLCAAFFCITIIAQDTSSTFVTLGPATFTAPGKFPTALFKEYYNNPTAASVQPQPIVTDPVTHKVYPLSLTDPDTLPKNDTSDPVILPQQATSSQLLDAAIGILQSINSNPIFENDACAACQASLVPAKLISLAAPELGPSYAVQFCLVFKLDPDCYSTYGIHALGTTFTQTVALADVGGLDGRMLCNTFAGACTSAPTQPLNLTGWFAKPKPNPLPPPKQSKGRRAKVLHTTDFHLDARYANGAEANCTTGLCCRSDNVNVTSPNQPVFPAPRYPLYLCDTNLALAGAVFETIPVVTGTEDEGFLFSIYTGDIISHDNHNQQSRDYLTYTETVVYGLLKQISGSTPVYASLGNHDSWQSAQDAPHSLPGDLGTQYSWNYDHVSALWEDAGWIPQSSVDQAKAHYAAYSVRRSDGLRMIVVNSDMWYTDNFYNYINMSTVDPSGMLRFLTDELQDAEDAGDRVWIIGHVLTGWTGGSALKDPSNLFYQIVDRYSPHVIAATFWGHSHMDQLYIFYTNNATVQDADTAVSVGWVAPSITPVTDYNVGFRMYEIDPDTFDVLDAHTWISDVASFPALDSQVEFGPTFIHEYSTREAYGGNITGWGPNDPLNATWWHLVTEAMEADPSLIQMFHKFQSKSSALTSVCDTSDCFAAQICFLRSGSASIAMQKCPNEFGGTNP